MIQAFSKYRFLLDQLVARDFKTKYKRSFLGVMWSFFEPLVDDDGSVYCVFYLV